MNNNKMEKIVPEAIEDILALTPLQEGMLFHYLEDTLSDYYFEQLCLDFSGELDPLLFERTWNSVAQTNEMLRTAFRWEKLENPVQIVLKHPQIQPVYHDLTLLTETESIQTLEKILIEDKNQKFLLHQIPFRITLCKIEKNRYKMIISNHHILYDGWSTGIILEEFFKTYSDLTLLEGKTLKKTTKQKFKEFVKGCRNRDEKAGEIFWSSYLEGCESNTGLMIESKKKIQGLNPQEETFGSYLWKTGFQTKTQWDHFLKTHKITLASLLYTAWGILLQKYNNSNDAVFGTTVSGRSLKLPGIEEMVGLFINTLPFRVQTLPHEKAVELVHRMDDSLHSMEKFELTPLVNIKQYTQTSKGQELFDSLLALENYPLDSRSIRENNHFSINAFDVSETPHYDLTLMATTFTEGEIELKLLYKKEYFSSDSIERLLSHYLAIIETIIDNPYQNAGQIEIIRDQEKQKVLVEFNATRTHYPSDRTIVELFCRQAGKTPDHIALTGPKFHQGQLVDSLFSITYKELDEKSNRLAHLLMKEGVGTETIVAIMMERSIDMITGILGILKTGGAYMPIDREYPIDRTRYLLNDSNARFLVITHDPSDIEKVKEWQGTRIFIEDIPGFPVKPVVSTAHAGSLAYIIYTSGTTGYPKGVMVNHRNVTRLVMNTNFITLDEKTRILQTGAPVFDATTFEIWGSLLLGGQLVLVSNDIIPDADRLGQSLARHRITTLWLSSPLFNQLMTQNSDIFPGLEYLLVGGDALSPPVINTVRAKNKHLKVINGYGPTENTTFSTTYVIDRNFDAAIPIGKPIANSTAYILDKNGNLQPPGVFGELYVGGDGVARGYLNRPELTRGSFVKPPLDPAKLLLNFNSSFIIPLYKIGDRQEVQLLTEPDHSGYIAQYNGTANVPTRSVEKGDSQENDERGMMNDEPHCVGDLLQCRDFVTTPDSFVDSKDLDNTTPLNKSFGKVQETLSRKGSLVAEGYLYRTGDLCRWLPDGNIEFLGRADHQVKIRGFRVELGEIEYRLKQYSEINGSVVIIKEDNTGDKYLCAYIASDEEINIPALKDRLTKELPDYMIPSVFVKLNRIPLTASGKIDRTALPEPGLLSAGKYAPPRNKIEEQLADIWAKVLGRDSLPGSPIGIDDDFFELGGHSLKATVLLSRVHKTFNVKISIKELFQSPTIREFSRYLRSSIEDRCVSVIPAEKKEYYPLSSVQKRLYYLHQLDDTGTAYNISSAWTVHGIPGKEKLTDVFNRLIQRHESLRTSFRLLAEEPVQYVHEQLEFQIQTHSFVNDTAPAIESRVITRFIRPFDLSHAPLIRVGLASLEKEKHVLIVDMHHIISDGASTAVLIKEFTALWQGIALPPLTLQYNDFVQWQNSEKIKVSIKQQSTFWRNQLADEIPILNLPTDFPRPVTRSFEGSAFNFDAGEEAADALKKLALNQEATLFMVLLSIYLSFLSKITGQEDIIVGTPVSNRNHADLEPIIGMFVNTLPLRNFPTPGTTFKELLNQVKNRTLEAFAHQEYPFADIVEAAGTDKTPDRNPLFDTMFVLQNQENSFVSLPGLKLTPCSYERNISKFDLTLEIEENQKNLRFTLEYCSHLFKKETILRFDHYLKNIISSVLENPNSKIEEIDIIPDAEKEQLLFTFNENPIDFPHDRTIHRLFTDQAAQTPDNTAVVAIDNVHLSYRLLDRVSAQIAHDLTQKGIKPNTIVGIMAERSIETAAGILGILKSGGAYLPIDPEFPPDRIEYMIKDSNAAFILTKQEISAAVQKVAAPTGIPLSTRDKETFIQSPISTPGAQSSDLAYIIYTSGTTGKPKGVLVEHKGIANLKVFWAHEKGFGVNVSDHVLQFANITFDASVTEFFMAFFCGSALYLLSKETIEDYTRFEDFLQTRCITVVTLPPPYLMHLDPKRITTLRKLITAGSETNIELMNTWKQKTDYINAYGPTEITICAACWHAADAPHPYPYSTVPIGAPIFNTQVFILGKNHSLLPLGVVGEVYIAGIGVSRGYLNRPEMTAERFVLKTKTLFEKRVLDSQKLLFNNSFSGVQGRFLQKEPLGILYCTGDLARWLPDGNIEFIGRSDHQVKIRGFRVELNEIEHNLSKHPAITQAVVIASEKKGTHEKYICAYFISNAELPVPHLHEYLAKELPSYMIPSYFVRLDKIPLTPNGKIDRKALPDPTTIPGERETYSPPRDKTEKALAEIWTNVLMLTHPLGIDDNFFHIGGHSLNATALAARIHKTLDVKIPMGEIIKNPTVRGLAQFIKNSVRTVYKEIEPVEEKEYYALSSSQKRLFFIHQMGETSTAYNMPSAWTVEGEPHKKKLERVFSGLIRRHESFRTSFHTVAEQPVQKIHDTVDFKLEVYSPGLLSNILNVFLRPFDLSQAPLLRAGYIAQDHNKFLLMVDMHHIISDGISVELFLEEFKALYAGEELPPLRVQYKDYSEARGHLLPEISLQQQETYWLDQFQGELPVLNLYTDFPRPAVQSYPGNSVDFELDERETTALKQLARSHETTGFVTLLTIYYLFLAKITAQQDIVIGIPASGRRHADLEPVIGMFVNTAALRNYPSDDKTFNRFLNEVKQQTLLAFENQDYPFEELVGKISIQRDPGRNPLFDTMFTFQETAPRENANRHPRRLNVTPYYHKLSTVKFDLTLTVIEKEKQNGLLFMLAYCTALFKESTFARYTSYFKQIISQAVNNPSIHISQIEIITPEEKNRILEEFNATQAEYPSNRTIQELFAHQAEKTPDRVALVGPKIDKNRIGDPLVSITYKELDENSNRLAQLLKKEGVEPETIVAVMMERSIDIITAILGTLKAGGAYLPIDREYPQERIHYLLADSSVNFLVISQDPIDIEKIKNWNRRRIFIEDSAGFPSIPVPLTIHPGSLAYIIYTSGTTGYPKGVMVSHRNVARLVMNTDYISLDKETRILQTGAPVFDATTFEIWGSLLSGGLLVLVTNDIILDADRLGQSLDRHGITTLWLSSPLFNQLMTQNSDIFHSLEYLLVGGDVLSPAVINTARAKNKNLKVINGYGPTENTTFSTTYLIDRNFEGTIPIGKPIANSTAYVLDRNHHLQPVGIPGELYVGGDGAARGYLNRPALTAERFVLKTKTLFEKRVLDSQKLLLIDNNPNKSFCGGPGGGFHEKSPLGILYRTGDLCRWLPDGNIEFLGRVDHQVKIRGFRVELGEIEHKLKRLDGVTDALVIVKPDKTGDKYLCAYIVTPGEIKTSTLKEHLSKELPDYMIPAYFTRLSSIPLNPNGKVDYKALPSPELVFENEFELPRNDIERKLAEIWSDLLGIGKDIIGIHSDFFQVGGHSLKAALLAARIHKTFDVSIPIVTLFSSSTIAKQASYIKESSKDLYIPLEPAETKEYYAVSPAQKRMYLLQQLDENGTVYNIPSVWILEGDVDKNKLERIFKQIILRHESLRTSFHIIADEPVQKIHPRVDFEMEIHAPGLYSDVITGFIRPFDLSRVPLLRAGLVAQGVNKYLLMVDMHHIISDGISVDILIKEFKAYYTEGEPAPLRIQYKDYSEARSHLLPRTSLQHQESFWLDQFQGEIPVLNLHTDFPRPTVQSFAGAAIEFELLPQETKALKELAHSQDATVFMTLLTIYNIFLAKLSNQQDIIIGIPTAGRKYGDLEPIIGMFVSTLALKNYPSPGKTFTFFLHEIKQQTVQAFDNQDYPFEDLVEKIAVARDPGRNPLFDTMFTYRESAVEEIVIGETKNKGLKIKSYSHELNTVKFDLTLTAVEKQNRLLFILAYCTALFEGKTIDRYTAFFKRIISQVLNTPSIKISQIEIITPEEKDRILYEFNHTETPYPGVKTIIEIFEEQALRNPDRIAVTAHPVSLAYSRLDHDVHRLAQVLKQRGVTRDTIVGIKIQRSIEMVIGILGILEAGGAYLPIDPEYPEERIDYILKDSNAALLLTTGEISAAAQSTAYSKDYPAAQNERISLSTGGTSNLAYVIYTSGSTGLPKGVMVDHFSILNTLLYLANQYPCTSHGSIIDNYLLKTSFLFDVSVTELLGWFIKGGMLTILEPGAEKEPAKIIETIELSRITHINFVPSMFNVFVQMLTPQDIPRLAVLKYVFLAGEALWPALVSSAKQFFPQAILENLYGPTEASVYASGYSLDFLPGKSTAIPIGKPLANVKLFISDQNGCLQPIGVPGELLISGAGLARGYLNRPALTAERFVLKTKTLFEKRVLDSQKLLLIDNNPNKSFCGGPGGGFHEKSPLGILYRTGDLCRWLPDGNIEFLGRIDHQVKIRGFRIELGEIESRMLDYYRITDAVVIVRETGGDKSLCAYYVSTREVSQSQLIEYLSQKLPAYMIPSYFVQLEKMPLTPTGKIDRKALPAPEFDLKKGIEPPRDEIEAKLVDIWSDLLGINKDAIGIHSDFFHLGGHSLKAVLLAGRLHKAFDAVIPLVKLFACSTIAKLASHIKETAKNKYIALEPAEIEEYYAVTPAQKRMYLLQQMDETGTAYNLPSAWELENDVDRYKLERTFKQVIRRHESFRTSFHMVEDKLVQKIYDSVDFELESLEPGPRSTIITNFIRPFDLSRAPLLRVGLIAHDPGSYLLMVDMHHIISDGISVELFIKEFKALYALEELPPLRVHYKDYSEARSRLLPETSLKKQESFWLDQFQGEIPVLNLYTDFPRPAVQSFEGAAVEFELDSPGTGKLKDLADSQKATLFMTLLALYNIFLSKITNQQDIIIGTPTAGRRHGDLESIIGMFVSTLALRNYPSHDKTFILFLNEIKQQTIQAFENQDYPFEDLVEKIAVQRDPGRNPLFDTMFTYRESAQEEIVVGETQGLKITPFSHDLTTVKFDLTLTAVEKQNRMLFILAYCTHLFKEQTILNFTAYFKRIISQVAAAPSIKISQIEIITPEEKDQILFEFNNTDTPFSCDKNIMDIFREQSGKTPDQAAIISYPVTLSYSRLDHDVHRLVQVLKQRGVTRDTIVGIKIQRSIEMVIGILGILQAGGAYLPIDPEYPEERIDYILKDSSAALLLTAEEISTAVLSPLTHGESSLIQETGSSQPSIDIYSLAYVIYTSGSTGMPKGVLIDHYSILNTLLALADQYPCSFSDNYLLKTSFLFDVSVTELLGWFIKGGNLTVLEPGAEKEPARIIETIERHNVTHINFVPSMFNVFVQMLTPQDIRRLACIKYVFLAGEALWPGLVSSAKEFFPHAVLENIYGPTEAAVYASGCSLDRLGNTCANIPIGKPLANVKLFISDQNGYLQPIGVPGELLISGVGVARGYLNRPALTAERFSHLFVKRWGQKLLLIDNNSNKSFYGVQGRFLQKEPLGILYRTGDLCRWLPDGNIEFLGRIDHQVKIRGFRIELGEIESRMLEHDRITDAAVVVRETDGDKSLCAYYVSNLEIPHSQLTEYLSRKLPSYMIPSYFVQLDKMPLTPTGKIDRKALPAAGLNLENQFEPPRDEIEKKLTDIWSGVLGVPVGINSNFFETGGHSLKATIIITKIHKELGIKIPQTELFKTPTIKGLAAFIKDKGVSHPALSIAYESIEPAEECEYYPVSPSQQRFYILQQMTPDSTVNNIPLIIQPRDKTDREQLENAFHRLIERHESLRASFHTVADHVAQKVHEKEKIEFQIEYMDFSLAEIAAGGASQPKTYVDLPSLIRQFIRPFDLSRAPLVRAGLFKIESQRRILVIDMHHIISDGTSVQVLGRELMALYNGQSLPPLRLQYKDFCQWQLRLFNSTEMKTHEEYWLNQLKGPLPQLLLPRDFPGTQNKTYEGHTIRVTLDTQLVQDLYRLTRKTESTLYMVLLAALDILLYKYTGQEDIIVGSPIARRDHIDLENIIGLIMESIVIRNFFPVNDTFLEFLAKIKTKTLEAYEHQSYPHDELLKKLDSRRDNSMEPLTRTALIVQNMTDTTLVEQFNSDVNEFYIPNTSKLDLTLSAWEFKIHNTENITLEFEYNTGLFKWETIKRLTHHFIAILKAITENLTVPLSDIIVMDSQELFQLTHSDAPCFHLSHPQQRIYSMEKTFPNTGVGILAFTIRFPRVLRIELLEQAIDYTLQKHDGLRLQIVETSFDPQPLQYVSHFKPIKLDIVDFRGQDSETRFQQWIEEDTRKCFELMNSPLFYFAYLRFNESQSGYYMKVHHLVSDGWSASLLFQEINDIYETLESGGELDLTPAPSYTRYLEDERRYLRSPKASGDREFWHRTLIPLPEAIELSSNTATDYTRIKGHVRKFPVPSFLRNHIQDYCRDNKTSVYKLISGALAVYLFRITGKEDFVIGSASHNRTSPEKQQTAGMFVSTIPIRIRTKPDDVFHHLVQEIGQHINYIIKNHQEYPFDLLMQEIREKTRAEINYLLNITLVGHGDLKEGPFEMEHHFAGYDPTHITIHINNKVDRDLLELEWVYQEALFSPDRVERIHQSIVNILEHALSSPHKTLTEIDLVSPAEKEQLLFTWNNTESPFVFEHVGRLFHSQAEQTPDHIALVGSPAQTQINPQPPDAAYISYRELNRRADRLAVLLKENGVEPDTIVAVLTGPTIEMAVALLGVVKSGGAYLPINPETPEDRIFYMLADSQAKILLCSHSLDKIHETANKWNGVKLFLELDDSPAIPSTSLDNLPSQIADLAYIIYTSGSTGKPKAVAVEHRNLLTYIHAFAQEFHLHTGDTVIQQASFAFDAFVEEFYPILLAGGKLAVPTRDHVLDIDMLCRFIQKHYVTMITCSPLMLNELNQRTGTHTLDSIRIFISGADRLNFAYIENLLKIPNAVVYNTYGPTETTVCATYCKCSAESPSMVPIGKPIANYRTYILDKYSQLLPTGISGELCISGPAVTRGYLNRPALTAERFSHLFVKRWGQKLLLIDNNSNKSFYGVQGRFLQKEPLGILYRTGDLCRWLPDGNIEFQGRIDQQVKIRGYRVELEEIENELLKYKEIKEAAVCVKNQIGDRQENSLCAYVVPHTPGSLDKKALREYLAVKLPGYMIPDYFIEIKNIPLTPNGKTDRKKLPALTGNLLEVKNTFVAPNTGMEKSIAAVWMEVLGVEKVGLHDNFFELGGNSLKVTQLNSKIKKALNQDIPMVDMFKYQTIHSFTGYLTAQNPGGPTQIQEALEKESEVRSDLIEKAKDRRMLQKNKRLRGI